MAPLVVTDGHATFLCWFCFPGRARYSIIPVRVRRSGSPLRSCLDYISRFSYRAGKLRQELLGIGVGGGWVYCAGAQGDSQRD